ncbi:hypothetical protein Tco_0497525 [Tanacetum coccineum]
MTTLADKAILSGADNRPPMLEKDMYDSWKSIMELYMMNRQHGRMILESVENGPLIWPSIEENGVIRPKKYSELSATEAIQADCDIKATNIILQGLPPEVYALVSNHKVAKELWARIQLLMQGTSLTKQERECKLYDEFDKFAYKKGETLREFYLRFSLLLNDMNIYNMKLEQFQVNTKFLNTLPPEWSKFVTDVKLVRDLHTTNVDQLHAYLGQHEFHANEVRLMHERNSDPLALVATHQMTQSPYQTHQNSYQNTQFQPQVSPYQSPQYGSPYQSQQYSTHQSSTPFSITYPSNDYQSLIHHNVYSPSSSIPQLEYAPIVNQQSEFSQPDSGLIVLVFQKGNDPIDAINHIMSFLTVVVTSRYPTTNNQLRNLSNPRKQTTINNGRVALQPIQGRQTGRPHVQLNTAKVALMASLSHYGSDALAESNVVNHSETKITSDDNIIPYSQYVIESQQASVQNSNSYAQQDALILSVIEQLKIQVVNYLSAQSVEIDRLKQTLFEHLKEKESLMQTVTLLKNDFKKEESRNIDREIALENKIKQLDNIFFKRYQSAQTVHMLTKPQFLYDHTTKQALVISKDIVNTIVNSSVDTASVNEHECEKCLKLETELLNKKDFVEKEIYDKLDNSVSNQSAPSFDQLFELNELKSQSQEKDTVIKKLKERIKSLSVKINKDKIKKDLEEIETINIELYHRVSNLIAENEHLKQTYKQLYYSIKPARIRSKEQCDDLINQVNLKSVEISDLNASLQEKVLGITTLKDDLRKLKGKSLVDNADTKHTIDVEPITPKLFNKKTAHSAYIKHTQEESAVLKDLIEHVKSKYPLDYSLESTCRYIWRPTGRTFTIVGNACPLTRITTTTEVPLRKPTDLENETPKPVVTLVYSRKPRKSKTNVPVSKSKVLKFVSANKKEPSQSWGSIVFDIPSSSLDDCRSSKLFSRFTMWNDLDTTYSPIHKVVAPAPAVSTGSPSSTNVDQDAPSPSNSYTTPKNQPPVIPNDVEGDNHDIEVAHMDNDPYFGISIPDVPSDQSSSTDSIHTIVHPYHQIFEHNSKWTKDHPLENIISEFGRPVSTRLQLHEQTLFCYYDSFLTIVEPKTYKDALTQSCWIEAM